MKFLPVAAISIFLATTLRTFAGAEIASESPGVFDTPRFEMAVESAYLLGVFGNPNSYEIGAEFLTARVRWGTIKTDSWFRGYNQFYVSAMAEPIFRGVENLISGSTSVRAITSPAQELDSSRTFPAAWVWVGSTAMRAFRAHKGRISPSTF